MKTSHRIITTFSLLLFITSVAVSAGIGQTLQATGANESPPAYSAPSPENQQDRLLALMHQNRYQEKNITKAQKMIQNSAQENLPTEPLMNKAMEGIAKQVPEDLVITAMVKVQNRHRSAQRLARSLSDDPAQVESLTSTVADCLAAGMTETDMEKIAEQLRQQTRQRTKNEDEEIQLQTMLTTRSMMRLGAQSSDVVSIVDQALDNQFTARNMEKLRHQFSQDSQFASAKNVAHQYSGDMSRGDHSQGGNSGSENSGDQGKGGKGGSDAGSGGSGQGGAGAGSSDAGSKDSGNSNSGGKGSGDKGSGGTGSGGSGQGGSGSGGNGSGGNGSGGNSRG